MESKRKKRKVQTAVSATHAPKKSPPQDKPTSAEALIVYNGNLVESLLSHDGWQIIQELIDEGVASVSGRKTNGYYYDGDLTRGNKDKSYLTGYQEALTQLNNRTRDFIRTRDNLIKSKKVEEADKDSQVYNPFTEEMDNDAF